MSESKKVSPRNAAPDLLAARLTIAPDAFDGMKIAVLKMPYSEPLFQFGQWLKARLEKNYNPRPPYRLLNDALTACAPTLVHGFEWYSGGRDGKGFRLLAVGKPIRSESGAIVGSTLAYPSEEQVALVMRLWLQQWGERPYMKDFISAEGKAA